MQFSTSFRFSCHPLSKALIIKVYISVMSDLSSPLSFSVWVIENHECCVYSPRHVLLDPETVSIWVYVHGPEQDGQQGAWQTVESREDPEVRLCWTVVRISTVPSTRKQLSPSPTRLHQNKMKLLLWLLLCHDSSAGKITFEIFTFSSARHTLVWVHPQLDKNYIIFILNI